MVNATLVLFTHLSLHFTLKSDRQTYSYTMLFKLASSAAILASVFSTSWNTHAVTHSHEHWSISKMRDEKDSKAIKVGEMVLDGEMRRYSLCLCDLPWCLQCSVMWAFVQLIGRKSTRISFCPAVSSRHCIFCSRHIFTLRIIGLRNSFLMGWDSWKKRNKTKLWIVFVIRLEVLFRRKKMQYTAILGWVFQTEYIPVYISVTVLLY